MIPLLRAEVRKLFTIRSTYILAGIALALAGFISFWVLGYKGDINQPRLMMESANTAATVVGMFVAITAVLLVAHEYRFNTIMYTLTSANSRSKVLAAKLLVATAYALAFASLAMLFGLLLTWLGLQFRPGDSALAPQDAYYWHTIWRSLFFVWGYMMVGMFVAVLVRHVVGAVVVLLIVPSTIEGLLSMVLKENSKYLPFHALEQTQTAALMSPGKGALIFSLYLVVGWAIAWFFFLRRDAN